MTIYLSYFDNHIIDRQLLFAKILKNPTLPAQTWQLKLNDPVRDVRKRRKELVFLSPSIVVERAVDNRNNIFVGLHTFDSDQKTSTINFCEYNLINENEFVVNFDQKSKKIDNIKFQNKKISINDFFNHCIGASTFKKKYLKN